MADPIIPTNLSGDTSYCIVFLAESRQLLRRRRKDTLSLKGPAWLTTTQQERVQQHHHVSDQVHRLLSMPEDGQKDDTSLEPMLKARQTSSCQVRRWELLRRTADMLTLAQQQLNLEPFLTEFSRIVMERGLQRKLWLKINRDIESGKTGWTEFEFPEDGDLLYVRIGLMVELKGCMRWGELALPLDSSPEPEKRAA